MARITIAALLLIWVITRVHWRDYVVDKDTNESYAVLASQTDATGQRLFRVASGILWWSDQQLRPAGDFAVDDETVRFGLAAVKGVGHNAVDAIVAAREEHGKFTDLYNFCELVDPRSVNKGAIETVCAQTF